MLLVIRGRSAWWSKPFAFVYSLGIHAGIVALLVMSSSSWGPDPEAASIYDQTIRHHEKQIIWYHPSGKLPEIASAGAPKDLRPPRAKEKFDQSIVARAKD